MTTEDMIKQIYDYSYKHYKQSRNCPEGLKLDRKEPVEIQGIEFSCWKEYVMFKVAEYLQDKLPYADVQLNLDGNDTTIDLVCSDDEQRKLNSNMFSLIKEVEAMGGGF